MTIKQGDILWQPGAEQIKETRLASFMEYLKMQQGKVLDDYASLWQWSVDELEAFWKIVWDFFDIQADGDPEVVLAGASMPGAKWFPNVRLNYAEHVFRNA